MEVRFIWKLIGGDMFEQSLLNCEDILEAFNCWQEFWQITPKDCEIFKIEVLY